MRDPISMVAEHWRDLLSWTPSVAGREARLRRFAVLWGRYEAAYGPPPRVVKITGTSGKGSVAAMLSAALEHAGKRTGLFTSPHLVDPLERIRIGGVEIVDAEFQRVFEQTQPFFAALRSELGDEYRPSFFEAWLILALRAFAERGVDIAILESAVGGYNDILSLIPSKLAVITTVGLDHAEELGPTVAHVARDKAGIASPCSTLVLGPRIEASAVEIILTDARARGLTIRIAELARVEPLRGACPLRGAFQFDNLATVMAVLEQLADTGVIRDTRCIRGVADTVWPGRLESFEGPVTWLLDAAHNQMSFAAVAEFLRTNPPEHGQLLAFGTSDGEKAVDGLRLLAPLFDRVLLVSGFYRSFDIRSIATEPVFDSPDELVSHIVNCAGYTGSRVVVTGSVYLVGACRRLLLDLGYPIGRPELEP